MKFKLHSARYFYRILLWTTAILFCLCLLVGLYLNYKSNKDLNDSIYQAESITTEDFLLRADAHFSEINTLTASVATISVPYSELQYNNNYWALEIWSRLLNSHTSMNGYINSIETVVDGHTILPSAVSHDRDLGKFGYYEFYTAEDIVWPYLFDMRTDFHSKALNDITITVSGYYMSKQVFGTSENGRQDYLLTKDNLVLLTSERSAFFQDIETVCPGVLDTEGLGTDMTTYGQYYVFISKANRNGLRTLSLVPKAVYSAQRTAITRQALLITSFMFLICLVISYALSRHFYNPVRTLVKLIRTYVPDDINEYEDEISFIHQNLSVYLSKTAGAENRLAETTKQLQNAQSAVLQHQINHHFLYNTLENFKALSVKKLGIGNEIENGIILLNNIICEGIFQKNAFVTLSHELSLVNSYLSLMQLRFPNIAVRWDIDESVLDCMVFKFSMQPILENCFAHAFSGIIMPDKLITIQIKQSQGVLHIYIRDNGCGMDAETLQKINLTLAAPDDANIGDSVGILNVHKRISCIFGKPYGLSITQEAPGTCVHISYPITQPVNISPEVKSFEKNH